LISTRESVARTLLLSRALVIDGTHISSKQIVRRDLIPIVLFPVVPGLPRVQELRLDP